jgi:hypothetical protein
MRKLNLNFRFVFCVTLAIASAFLLANTVRLYAERQIDPLGFLFAAGACGLGALLLSALSLEGSEDEMISILESPQAERNVENRPTSPDFFGRWFGGLGDAA